MAYSMSEGTYSCDICGVTMPWDGGDDINGVMWGCEICESNFCTKCFVAKYGSLEYLRMQKESDKVCCPSCWVKYRQELIDGDGCQ